MSRRRRALGSCKYGAECGLVVDCECDCCIEVHPCECEPEDYGDDYPEGMGDDVAEAHQAVGRGRAGRKPAKRISRSHRAAPAFRPRRLLLDRWQGR